jgi:hypothetical protein
MYVDDLAILHRSDDRDSAAEPSAARGLVFRPVPPSAHAQRLTE